MSFPPIIYIGPSGLDADVFQSYMACSGYRVLLMSSAERALAAAEANPSAITIIAMDKKPDDLVKLANEMCARASNGPCHVFILVGSQAFETGEPSFQVIPRPFRLAEVSRRIQALTRFPAR